MKAGFIGIGHLGWAMTVWLASQGVDLIFLWNRSPEKTAGMQLSERDRVLASDEM